MTSGGNNFSDFPETTPTGHRITKNNRLTHLGEMPGEDERFAGVGGVSPTLFTCKKLLCLCQCVENLEK